MRLTESILKEIGKSGDSKPLDREKYSKLMSDIEDIVTSIGDNKEQLNDLIKDVNNEFKRLAGESSINESYQMGTMTEEQYESICERLGIAYSNASGGINRFSHADISIIKDFLSEGLLDSSDAQNNAPSIKEIISFSEKEGISNFEVDGYVVVPSRDDSRISIDGVEFDYDDSLSDEVEAFVGYADEKSTEGNHASAWWD